MIAVKCFHIHLDKRNKRAPEIRQFPAATIHDRSGGRDDAPVVTNDLDCFLHPPSAGHNVLREQKPFARSDREPPPKNESAAAILLHEDMPFTQMARNFLPDNNSANSWRNNRCGLIVPQTIGQQPAHARSDRRILKQKRTLKKLAAVQAAAQCKMAAQQRAGLTEEIKNFFHADLLNSKAWESDKKI